MNKRKPTLDRDELIAYATDLLTEAMRDGLIEPVAMIECSHFAAKPTLLDAMRAVAPLDPEAQMKVMVFARRLSDRVGPVH
jgi:hypothetical protein